MKDAPNQLSVFKTPLNGACVDRQAPGCSYFTFGILAKSECCVGNKMLLLRDLYSVLYILLLVLMLVFF